MLNKIALIVSCVFEQWNNVYEVSPCETDGVIVGLPVHLRMVLELALGRVAWIVCNLGI